MSATETMSISTPPKLLRYRTVREKSYLESHTAIGSTLSPKEVAHAESANITTGTIKANTKYRKRAKTLTSAGYATPASPPPVPVLTVAPFPPVPGIRNDLGTAARDEDENFRSPKDHHQHVLKSKHRHAADQGSLLTTPVATAITADSAVIAPTQALADAIERHTQLVMEGMEKQLREEKAEAAKWSDEVARLEAETDRILAEQRKRDMVRLQSQHLTVQKPSGAHAKAKSPVMEKFAFLSRGRRSNAATLSPTSSTCASLTSSRAESLDPALQSRTFVDPGRGLFKQSSDSSVTMTVTAGRRVTVRCRGLTMTLPITQNSTAVDLISMCSNELSQRINTETSILVETYSRLGLERRLRRYESILDVLNSWDCDTENSLIVIPNSFRGDVDLELSSVPEDDEFPRGFTAHMYHSGRPSKWNKRYITLLENGQMFASKKLEPSPSDKDVHELCHLTESDIYTPTEDQIRKQYKSPKKYCYAIKSQKRTTELASMDSFVHFFSTDDPTVAHKFYTLVHAWRSWYVSKTCPQPDDFDFDLPTTPTVKSDEPPPQIPITIEHPPKKSTSHVKVDGHKVKVSVDESPYAIGAFQPLLDLSRFDKPLDEFGRDWIPDPRTSVLPPKKETEAEPVPEQERLPVEPSAVPEADAAQATPAAQHETSEEKSAAPAEPALVTVEREQPSGEITTKIKKVKRAEAPLTPKPEPQPWFPSATEHSARVRVEIESTTARRPSTSSGTMSQHERRSRRHFPAPLVDLTPQFREAPQWSREGRGRGVQAHPGAYLVDMIQTAPPPGSPAQHYGYPGGGQQQQRHGRDHHQAAGGQPHGHPHHPLSPMGRFLHVPPRDLIRRPGQGPPPASPLLGRPSTSDGGSSSSNSQGRLSRTNSSAGGGMRNRVSVQPPVPPLPSSAVVAAATAAARRTTGSSATAASSSAASVSSERRREGRSAKAAARAGAASPRIPSAR